MDIRKLKIELVKLNVPMDAYSLNGGLPNETYCIGNNHGTWEVYYSERGHKIGLTKFRKEDEACNYFLSEMKKIFW